jgi:hypothetical protein
MILSLVESGPLKAPLDFIAVAPTRAAPATDDPAILNAYK